MFNIKIILSGSLMSISKREHLAPLWLQSQLLSKKSVCPTFLNLAQILFSWKLKHIKLTSHFPFNICCTLSSSQIFPWKYVSKRRMKCWAYFQMRLDWKSGASWILGPPTGCWHKLKWSYVLVCFRAFWGGRQHQRQSQMMVHITGLR